MVTEFQNLAKEIVSNALIAYKTSTPSQTIYALRRLNEELTSLKNTYEMMYGVTITLSEFKDSMLLK